MRVDIERLWFAVLMMTLMASIYGVVKMHNIRSGTAT